MDAEKLAREIVEQAIGHRDPGCHWDRLICTFATALRTARSEAYEDAIAAAAETLPHSHPAMNAIRARAKEG